MTVPLEKPDQQHLRAAHGYIQLGMFDEANAELEKIDPFCRHLPEVLVTRVAIYHGLKRWELMAIVAGKLVEWNPQKASHFVDLAYAKRRTLGLHVAHAVLTRAAELHSYDGTIQFNLACDEAELGNLSQAKANLERATRIDPKFRLMALEDPDLQPLWNSLAAG